MKIFGFEITVKKELKLNDKTKIENAKKRFQILKQILNTETLSAEEKVKTIIEDEVIETAIYWLDLK